MGNKESILKIKFFSLQKCRLFFESAKSAIYLIMDINNPFKIHLTPESQQLTSG